MVEQDNYTLRNRFLTKNAQLTFTNKHFWQTCNAAVTSVCRQLALWRMSYLPVHKEPSADRLQKKKLSQRLSKRYFWLSVATRGRKAFEEGTQNPHFHHAVSLRMCKREVKTPSPNFFFFLSISDTLQTVSKRLRACLSCACTPNGAGSGDNRSGVTARTASGDEEPGPASNRSG